MFTNMKAYELLSRLRYLELSVVDGKIKFLGDMNEWDIVRARDSVYIELANMGKI